MAGARADLSHGARLLLHTDATKTVLGRVALCPALFGALAGGRDASDVTMPFTIQQFFDVFASYNAAIWPAQVAAYVLGLAAVASLWLQRAHASKFILSVLALMWLWNGISYHFLFFSAINPLAMVFAGVFVVQALLLATCIASTGLSFHIGRNFRSVAGLGFILYAMFIYPALGFWAGHGFMSGPMFGVAPCPTTIFTIGLLLLARGHGVPMLAIVPILWSLVGLAAALQLSMFEDIALPLASLVLGVVLAADRLQGRRDRKAAALKLTAR